MLLKVDLGQSDAIWVFGANFAEIHQSDMVLMITDPCLDPYFIDNSKLTMFRSLLIVNIFVRF